MAKQICIGLPGHLTRGEGQKTCRASAHVLGHGRHPGA